MDAKLYWTLTLTGVTLGALYAAATLTARYLERIRREVTLYRKRRKPELAFPPLGILARPAWSRRMALGALMRGLFR